MTIEIPQNDYVQTTEIRQEVVQAICEAFLASNCWTIFHPFSDGAYRPRHRCVIKHKGNTTYYGFHDENCAKRWDDDFLIFNGAEMKAAFAALIKAGYHMFRIYQYRTWMGYKLSKKPCMQDGKEVFEFNDFID